MAMNNQFKWALAIIIIAIAIAAIMIWSRPVPQKEERVEKAPLVETSSLNIASGAIPLVVSGTVQARNEVVIAAEVSGRLVYVNPNFREGSFVSGGSVLMRIDPADYQNQVRIARADVAAQDVAVLEAREQMAIARDDLERYNQRERQQVAGGSSRILPPDALNQEYAGSSPASSKNGTRSSSRPSGLASREPQLRSARAARERAAASLADAQLSLSRTRISPPFGGLVSAENASIGTFVQTGQSLGTIIATNAYDVRLSMTQDEAALIPGLLQGEGKNIRADIYYDYGGQRYRWTAYIDRADASLDSTTRNVEVFVRVPNPLKGGKLTLDEARSDKAGGDKADGDKAGGDKAAKDKQGQSAPPLLIGAFVEAQIAGAPQGQYAAIASSALRPGNEIWLVRDGKLQIVPVRVIRRGEKLAYIAGDALAGGGRLVTSSLTAPTNNMPVRLANKAAK
jgi:multidrug efflux pump subunit AcrA (membrane-fusion protein)